MPPEPETSERLERYLLIVAQDQSDLYEYLARSFVGDGKVEVLLDRRVGERRRRAPEPERRREERRRRSAGNGGLGSFGVTIIRPERAPLPSEAVSQGLSGARILIIDDEPAVREILTELLASQGYSAVACADGQSGLALLQKESFDLVVTDLAMPGLSGWDVARAVKLRTPNMPVVMVTASADQIHPGKARASGVDFVIPKPFRFEEVAKTVALTLTLKGSGWSPVPR